MTIASVHLKPPFALALHGLPLIGHGDWNDGMNRVGCQGRGESVWLAWFAISCLTQFAELAKHMGDASRANRLEQQANLLRESVETHGWDGSWYRRAFFDDGTPLGSAQNAACSIDSIAQSWAVLSGAGDPSRARQAMEAVDHHLVKREGGLILLFDPPFVDDSRDAGYINGYLPGVRENGGQYTHAAAWAVQATARLGRGRHALALLEILNPIRHAQGPAEVARYKVEPYIVAGDVYSRPPHEGRGGWTWYTGSASWIYQAILESVLGIYRLGNRIQVKPCVSPEWAQYEVTYQFRSASYRIVVENPFGVESGVSAIYLDNELLAAGSFPLTDDGLTHEVRVLLGPHKQSVNELSAVLSSGAG